VVAPFGVVVLSVVVKGLSHEARQDPRVDRYGATQGDAL
jgi:hypothetical protein